MISNPSTQAGESTFAALTPASTTGRKTAKPSTTFATQSSDQTFAVIVGRILAGMANNPALSRTGARAGGGGRGT